ncbi:unnamed protein product [Closterium sp. NIES-65]|nr:unnamed protein product [Closterium sp. NIES-65]
MEGEEDSSRAIPGASLGGLPTPASRASFRLGSVFNGQEIGWDDAIVTRRREEVREWESLGPGPVTEEQGTRGKEKDPDWRPAPGEAAGTSGGSGDEGWGGRGAGQAGGSGARGFTRAEGANDTRGHVCDGLGRHSADANLILLPSALTIHDDPCVQKERMIPEDMYVMAPDGTVLVEPKCFEMRGAGAVIHSHGMETAMATMLVPGAKEFRVAEISHMEMIKGIVGHGYYDELVVAELSTPFLALFPHSSRSLSPSHAPSPQISHMEMIKGIVGHGYYDELVVAELSTPFLALFPHSSRSLSPSHAPSPQISHMEMIKGIVGHGYYDELVVAELSTPFLALFPHSSRSLSPSHAPSPQISHMEMIKGIVGHGYYDELVVPIIENTAREYELTDSLAAAVSSLHCLVESLVRLLPCLARNWWCQSSH